MGRRPRSTTGMLCPLHETLGDLRSYPFRRLGDHTIDDALKVVRAVEYRELAVGARAVLENLERILDFPAASQLIYDVVDEPLQHFGDELAGRQLLLLPEVN